MALNPALVGKIYPPTAAYEVGREKIREFATAIGDGNPICHQVEAAQEAGHPDLVAPPTFPFVLSAKAMAMAIVDPELGLDYSRVVHGEQRFEYERPVFAGDTLVVTSSIEEIGVAGRNEILTTRADLETLDGELVARTYSVIISRGTAPSRDAQQPAGAA